MKLLARPKSEIKLQDRGLDASWVEANCQSLTAAEATQRLGYPAKSAGILLEGQGIQIQFKPDRPWKNEGDKKAAKYRSPLGDYDAMLPIHPENPNYWTDLLTLKTNCYQVDGHPCLVLTEGFFKAIAGCSNGVATIALLGVEMGLTSAKADLQGKRYLVPALEKFAQAGFGFVIAFDADAETNKYVVWAQLKLAEQLLKFKVPVYSATGLWSIEQGKGMDDYIQNYGGDSFKRNVLGKSLTHSDWLERVREKLERDFQAGDNAKPKTARYMKRYEAIDQFWGKRLRLNTLKQQVELDGKPLDLDFVRFTICTTLNIDIPKEEAIEIVVALALKNEYCPIVEYLQQLMLADTDIDLNELASMLLGTKDPLHAAYLKRHLIGSVARALKPGCQMDTALILQGEQGIFKSSFLRTLYGEAFFDDTMSEAGDKDELMKLHQHWAVEWAEFETQLSRKGYSRLKQFISTKVDNYRPPYGRTSKAFPRRSVLVGSTNEPEFLNDPSGDRRYWVIPVKKINLKLTAELRDRIWTAAVQAYVKGEQWWLTKQEKQLADEANKPFRVTDTWEDFISTYIDGREFVTIAQVLGGSSLAIDPAKQDKSSQMRASAILRRFGWNKGKRWKNNTWQRGWLCPDSERSTDPPPNLVVRGVDRGLEPLNTSSSNNTDPPELPFTPTFPENENCVTLINEDDAQKTLQESLLVGGSGGLAQEVELASNLESARLIANDLPQAEVDYSTYPHLTCDTTEAKRNQAEKIKHQLLLAVSAQELEAINQEFTTRCLWVVQNLLTKAELAKVEAIAKTQQLNLFSSSPSPEELWMTEENLQGMASALAECDDAQTLAALRQCWSPVAMNAACKLLSQAKHEQIRQWVIELNARTNR